MSSSEEEVQIDPLPPHRVRFTDMPAPLVDKAIRSKFLPFFLITLPLRFTVCEKAILKCKLDKEIATEIQTQIRAEPELEDETAGWHVISGKSFASAITYQTKFVLFFDLLDNHHKSFLMFKT